MQSSDRARVFLKMHQALSGNKIAVYKVGQLYHFQLNLTLAYLVADCIPANRLASGP